MATTSRIITPAFRACFVNLFRPRGFKNQDGTMGEAEFTIKAAFPPSADLTELKNQAKAAAFDKWGSNPPKNLTSPFRLNEDQDNPTPGIGDDWTIMTFKAKAENFSPSRNVVDASNQPILDETEVYSGAWFRVQVQAYAYDRNGNKGVSFGLRNVQKLKDDDVIGSANMPATKAFEAVEAPAGATSASSLFD